MKLKKLTVLVAITGTLLCAPSAFAQGTLSNDKPGSVAIATFSVVGVSVAPSILSTGGKDNSVGAPVALSGAFIVRSASNVGGLVDLLIEGTGNASNAGTKFSVKLSKSASDALAVSVGTTVNAVSETFGTTLLVSGKILAFIPNELGKTLLHQSRVPEAK